MLHCSESSDSSDGDFVEEEEVEKLSYQCLFCETTSDSVSTFLSHSSKTHSFNVVENFSNLEFYGIIKLINYCRAKQCTVEEAKKVFPTAEGLGDEYLKPVIEDDALLMVDFEELKPESEVSLQTKEHTIDTLEQKMKLLELKLAKVQTAYLEALESGPSTTKVQSGPEAYFESYADYTIHAEMLQDRCRTEAYRDFIFSNPSLVVDKDVLDVGCGTGILSMFCAKAGARSVTAVDNSKIVDKAKDIIRKNQLADKINIVEGKIEEVQLEKKYDILISEWMGYALLFECMLDSVIKAREMYLRPGGLMVPSRAALFLSAVSDTAQYEKRFGFWKDVYDFDMSTVIPELYKEAVVELVDSRHIISESSGFKSFDLSSVQIKDLEFKSPYQLDISRPLPLTALVVYFSCYFDGELSTSLHTSPSSEPTHWMQTVLYLESVLDAKIGDVIEGNIEFRKNPCVKRGYVIALDGVQLNSESEEKSKFSQTFFLH